MILNGYKQTEIGVIPQDWNVHTLEMLYNITSSKRVFQSQWRKSGIPFYRAREIAVMSEGKSAPEDLYIDADLYNQYTRQYGSIKKDDVLITGVGTLGKVYVVKENDQFYFKDGNIERNPLTEFNSNNTQLLTVEETKAKIAALQYIQQELNKEKKA